MTILPSTEKTRNREPDEGMTCCPFATTEFPCYREACDRTCAILVAYEDKHEMCEVCGADVTEWMQAGLGEHIHYGPDGEPYARTVVRGGARK